MSFALDFRMKFGRDVFIDLLGYRKYGHNEEEMNLVLQPLLYKVLLNESRDLYAAKVLSEGVIDIGFVKNLR
jgi:2-oxoglutarate dehydrogenase E1 component